MSWTNVNRKLEILLIISHKKAKDLPSLSYS